MFKVAEIGMLFLQISNIIAGAYFGAAGRIHARKNCVGLGQGQYFISREGYSRQFQERFGFIRFPGTLNVQLEEPFPAERQAIKIEGFAEEGRSFGECKCYRIKLNGIEATVVRPEKSRYPPELI